MPSETLEFDIRPQAKERPRFVGGRVISGSRTRDFESQMRWMIRNLWKRPILDCPVILHVKFHVKHATRRGPHVIRPDADNLLKAVKDCLNGIVVKDDALVWQGTYRKEWSEKDGIALTIEWE